MVTIALQVACALHSSDVAIVRKEQHENTTFKVSNEEARSSIELHSTGMLSEATSANAGRIQRKAQEDVRRTLEATQHHARSSLTSKRVDGSLTMTVESADAIRQSDDALVAISEVIATVVDVPNDHCKTFVSTPAALLKMQDTGKHAALADRDMNEDEKAFIVDSKNRAESLTFEFQITVPAAKTVKDIEDAIKAHSLTALTSEVDNRLQSKHISTVGLKCTAFSAQEYVAPNAASTFSASVFTLLATMMAHAAHS